MICHNAWILYMKWRNIAQAKSTRSSSCGWTVLPLHSDFCQSFRLLVPGRQSARWWCRPLRHTWGETGSGHFESSSSCELHQVKTTWTSLSLQENANVFTVRLLQAYRCFGSGTITRHAKHIMTPPMTRMAPPIHPTKRAGPNVYLQRIQRVKQKVKTTIAKCRDGSGGTSPRSLSSHQPCDGQSSHHTIAFIRVRHKAKTLYDQVGKGGHSSDATPAW